MKILHILRSKPDELVQILIAGISEGCERDQVALYEGEVDYEDLATRIFEYDHVVSWW